jgi:putative ABC transport system substrate-binding protein
MVPSVRVIAVLAYRNNADSGAQLKNVQAAAETLGLQILAITVSGETDLEASFATVVREGAGALLILGDAFFTTHRVQLAILAARNAVPTIYTVRDFPITGGLMSYATNLTDVYRQVGLYVGRILKGEKPTDLPVVQPTKFDLVINLKTAKALGLTVPITLQVAADEVIE